MLPFDAGEQIKETKDSDQEQETVSNLNDIPEIPLETQLY